MKIQFQLIRFFISSFYTKPKQTIMQVVLIFAFFYMFIQLTVVNAFVYYFGTTQDLLFYNLVISNLLVFALIYYLSISTVFTNFEFPMLASLPLSFEQISSAKVVSSLVVPIGISMIIQLPTVLFFIIDGNFFAAVKLLTFLPILNISTALIILFVLSIINRYRHLFFNSLTYLIVNTLVVLLMATTAVTYFVSKSTIQLSNLFLQMDLSSISKLKDSLEFLLKNLYDTALAIPFINTIVLTFIFDKMTIQFLLLLITFLIVNALLYYLIILNVSKNYLKNGALDSNNINLKKSKAYVTKNRWGNYIQRELWVIGSEAYFKLHVVLTILMPPVFSFLFLVSIQNGWIPGDLNITKEGFFDLYFSYAVLFMSCVNNISGTPFSREGKYYYLIKSMPIHNRYLYFSKVAFSTFLSITAVLVSFSLYAFFGYWRVESIIMLMVVSCLVICYNLLTPLFDMKNPSTEWHNPSEAIKSNPNVLIGLLFGMPIPIVIAGIHFTLLWFRVSPIASAFIVLPIAVLTTMILIICLTKSKTFTRLLYS